jgi:hypothetical protein
MTMTETANAPAEPHMREGRHWSQLVILVACSLGGIGGLGFYVWLVVADRPNTESRNLALLVGVLGLAAAAFELWQRRKLTLWYLDRAEVWKGRRLAKRVSFTEPGLKYSWNSVIGGHRILMVTDGTGNRVYLSTHDARGQATVTPERVDYLRDVLQQRMENEFELALAAGQTVDMDRGWTITPQGVAIRGAMVPWTRLSVQADNDSGQITILRDGQEWEARGMDYPNAVPAANVMMRRAASGGWS